jgi:hypothetical protein
MFRTGRRRMLEDRMSVWPENEAACPALETSDGPLVAVSIDVDARHLERLLEALAQLPFPINPEIIHNASVVYRDAAGREDARETTLVEFPAYSDRIAEVRRVLEAAGFDPAAAQTTSMLEEIRGEAAEECRLQSLPPLPNRRFRRRCVAA